MAGLGSLATTAIITDGLTCGHGPLDPCKSGLITGVFDLYCSGVIPPTPISGGGGPYPRDAWNKFNPGDIQNFYQPVPEQQQYYVVPREKEAEYFRRHKIITMKIKLGDKTVEKEYSVPEDRARNIIKAASVVNTTISNITITATNIKRYVVDAVVTIKNLKLKK